MSATHLLVVRASAMSTSSFLARLQTHTREPFGLSNIVQYDHSQKMFPDGAKEICAGRPAASIQSWPRLAGGKMVSSLASGTRVSYSEAWNGLLYWCWRRNTPLAVLIQQRGCFRPEALRSPRSPKIQARADGQNPSPFWFKTDVSGLLLARSPQIPKEPDLGFRV